MTNINNYITTIPDFPKPGILFRDISPLLACPIAFNQVIETIAQEWSGKANVIAGLDARGFIFGTALAIKLKLPFIMIRKKGKLPGKTESLSYGLEYGENCIEISTESLPEDRNALVVDDLLATGGTAKAACELLNKVGFKIVGVACVIELSDLSGRKILKDYKITSFITY